MGDLTLGDDHETGRFLVQAMDQASPLGPAPVRKLATAADECVDEGTCPVAGGRMNHHSGRFVHYQQVGVLKDDSKRDVLAFYLPVVGGRLGHCDANQIVRRGAIGGAFARSVYRDESICD